MNFPNLMNPYIQAGSARDLIGKLCADWEMPETLKLSKTEREERCQIMRFFELAAKKPFISYPLSLFHTSKKNPDFKLEMPNLSVGIEASCITNEQLERAGSLESLQNACDSPDAFLVPGPKRTNSQLESAATEHYGEFNNVEDESNFWGEQTLNMIDRKTKIRRRVNYTDYGSNWLLLSDKLSQVPNGIEFPTRIQTLDTELQQNAYWTFDCHFDRIIIYDEPSKRLAMLSPDASELWWVDQNERFLSQIILVHDRVLN